LERNLPKIIPGNRLGLSIQWGNVGIARPGMLTGESPRYEDLQAEHCLAKAPMADPAVPPLHIVIELILKGPQRR